MIDLHTHTIFSDGALVPSELVRRGLVKGYRAIGLTDHVDESNIDLIIPRLVKVSEKLNEVLPITVIPGAELTHVPPRAIPDVVKEARRLGARLVVVHGETIVEPVEEGTNRAGIEGGADFIAHPGLITAEEVQAARERGIGLEITARKGHSLSNGYVFQKYLEVGAHLILNTDAHSPEDLITGDFAKKVLLSAGLNEEEISRVFLNSEELVRRVIAR